MSVPAVLLDGLAAARRRGESFEEAWPGALTAAVDPERVPIPDRECEHCGGPIPEGRGRPFAPALYCSDGCRRASHRGRERVAA